MENRIVDRVRSRVTARPNDPVAWRMLGKVLLLQGDAHGAQEALTRAIELDPQRVAAHYDLAEACLALEQTDRALASFRRVVELAPESEQAENALRQIEALSAAGNPFRLTNFQPRWIDTPARDDARLPPEEADSPWNWRVESGVLYNSNVALAPISRQLSPEDNGGFQAFLQPELEYTFCDSDHLAGGLELQGFYAVNQPDNDQFNLQHYEPGIYFDFPCWAGDCEIVPRLRYDFSYDIFAGRTLGTRHALTAEVAVYADDGASWIVYFTGDTTDFRDDGTDPAVDSLDGPTYTFGAIRTWPCAGRRLEELQISVDGEWADLRGADNAFAGMFVLLSSTHRLGECWELRPELGGGFRVYPDFTGAPNRDEAIWRAGGELRRNLSDACYVSSTFYYDRFDSANDEYAAQRYTAGVSLTYRR